MSILATIKEENAIELDITIDNWRGHLDRSEILIKEKDFENAASNLSQLLEFLEERRDRLDRKRIKHFVFDFVCLKKKKRRKTPKKKKKKLIVGTVEMEMERTRMDRKMEKKMTILNIDERRTKRREEEEDEEDMWGGMGIAGSQKTAKPIQMGGGYSNNNNNGMGGDEVSQRERQKDEALRQMIARSSSEDREVAWEALEMARLLCEGHWKAIGQKTHVPRGMVCMLMEIHSLLGEVQIENGMFERSIDEFEKAIAYYHRHCFDNIRDLTFFHFMCSKSAECAKLSVAFQFHLKTTVNLLYKRLVQMLTDLGLCPNEENMFRTFYYYYYFLNIYYINIMYVYIYIYTFIYLYLCVCVLFFNSEETLQSISNTLTNEQLKKKMGHVMYQDMMELQKLLDAVLAKEIVWFVFIVVNCYCYYHYFYLLFFVFFFLNRQKLVEEEIKEEARRHNQKAGGAAGTQEGHGLYDFNKENSSRQHNVAGTDIVEGRSNINIHDFLKMKRRKRTFGQAGIRDETTYEPVSKKFKS
ncbi:hypothetical protein RFI_13265 [Reticulomyxa filosa]|uniref:Uncharacterized protein n=1 Tax=Reticulomyxa filosa TaxID=46433 RepID=X6ND64_RETFI|nr:hypothetical protein RFI_13265 [Reticulomyxa filosa]|eukprot:ETO23891.1 hypothetical protein RFI_13265 [Reticulomyxa filosa]